MANKKTKTTKSKKASKSDKETKSKSKTVKSKSVKSAQPLSTKSKESTTAKKVNPKIWGAITLGLMILFAALLASYSVYADKYVEEKQYKIIENKTISDTPSSSIDKPYGQSENSDLNKSSDLQMKKGNLVWTRYTSIPDKIVLDIPSDMYIITNEVSTEFTNEEYDVEKPDSFSAVIGYTVQPTYGVVFKELYDHKDGEIKLEDIGIKNQEDTRLIKVGNLEVDGSQAVEYAEERIVTSTSNNTENIEYSHTILVRRADGSFVELYSWSQDLSGLESNKSVFMKMIESVKFIDSTVR